MSDDKPNWFNPQGGRVKGDTIPPWVWAGSDWVRIGSPEHEALIQEMIDEYKRRFPNHAYSARNYPL